MPEPEGLAEGLAEIRNSLTETRNSHAMTNEEARALLERVNAPPAAREAIMRDVEFANAVQAQILTLIPRMAAGEYISWAQLAEEIAEIATAHGHLGGMPMPAIDWDTGEEENPLILAELSPLKWVMDFNSAGRNRTTELAERMSYRHFVRNSWRHLGDATICVVDTEKGPMWIKEPYAGARMRSLLTDCIVRNKLETMTAEAELRALESLKTRIGSNQYRNYVLSGAFIERSPRSDLHYIFRKGFPTLVCSHHGRSDGKAIAALCLHPFGYYQYTHVGVMTPTDEVIAALLMMRGDEHKFWAKSGQWHVSDLRAGL